MKDVRIFDRVGANVDDLEAAKEFFLDFGLEVEGTAPVQGEWVVASRLGSRSWHPEPVTRSLTIEGR